MWSYLWNISYIGLRTGCEIKEAMILAVMNAIYAIAYAEAWRIQYRNLHSFNLAAVSLAQELAISQEEKHYFISWIPFIELFMHHLLIFN